MTDGEAEGDRIAHGIEPQSVERPGADAAASALRTALDRDRVVSLVGECSIEAAGDQRGPPRGRYALLKPDGSVIVHGSDGTAPVALLSGEGEFDATAANGELVVQVSGEEGVRRLRFARVDFLASAAVDASEDDHGDATEATPDRHGRDADRHAGLRERLLSNPDVVEAGFRPLATERETPAGPVDVYGRDAEGRAVVVEIKAHRAGPAAAGQLDRYVAALRQDLHADAEVRGALVAPSATERTLRLLEERGYAFRALSPDG